MKMLDPGSTVREGEFATAANSGGIPAAVINAYNKARDGKMLTPKQRGNFTRQARSQYNKATSTHKKRLDDYEKLGNRYGLERADVIISEPSVPAAPVMNHPRFGDITEEDIRETMRTNNMTREQVLERLNRG